MRITALTENTSRCPRIGCEHGLSLYIETASRKLLFDTGQSGLFAENASVLGVDLSEVELAILSHGHYDHSGGLRRFLEINKTAPVYLSRYAFEPHYNGTEKYIGMDPSLRNCDRLIFTGETQELGDGMTLYACSSRERFREIDSAGLYVKSGDAFLPEDFRHEQYLLISDNEKRILISGCSHKGILNIVRWFEPDVLIGGFHLSKYPLDASLAAYARELDRFQTVYYTCHCTGTERYRFMKPLMKNLHYLSAGETADI